MNAEQMWNKFVSKNQIKEMQYQSWAFGAAADELADLVLRGIKTGTASAYYTKRKTKYYQKTEGKKAKAMVHWNIGETYTMNFSVKKWLKSENYLMKICQSYARSLN